MTDQATNQSSEGGDAGGAADQAADKGVDKAATGGGGDGASWLETAGLPEDVRNHATVKKYAASPEGLARAVIHLEGHLGAPAEQIIRLPKPDDKDGQAALWNRLGRPETPDKYTAEIDGDQMDKETFSAFKAQAHEMGLTDAQVKGLAAWYAATGAQTAEKLQADDAAARTANEAALKSDYGAAYDQTVTEAAAAALKFGGEEYADYLKRTGLGNDPATIKAWAAVAKAAAEPGSPDPSNRGGDSRRTLSPAEAEAELAKMEADPEISKILTDPNHPNKDFYHNKRLELIKQAKPKSS